ncbi:hypothetical protein G6L30_17130 [Agrobacterium rhizogenes]|nr:hypothetical protein [Rhizobium rhizogenes]
MKTKTMKKIIRAKVDEWLASIDDGHVKDLARKNTIVTGGAIASMLLNEPVNDFDIYFRTAAAAEAVANYYVARFHRETGHPLALDVKDGRIRITTSSGHRGETVGAIETLGSEEIDDAYEQAEEKALNTEDDGKPPYRPVFLSTNAITLSRKVQIIVRFYGEPDAIHENYDFVHCTNYWTSWEDSLVLRQPALEALLAKELRYVGSKYPVCSIIRLRKFIKRGWTINAGQILKAVMQISELDLSDPKVLEDQLTGVDSAYFMQLMTQLKEKDPEKVNAAYLVEIIDRMF